MRSSEPEPPGARVLHKWTCSESTTSIDDWSRRFVYIPIRVFLYTISRAPRRCGQTLRACSSNFTAECRCISESRAKHEERCEEEIENLFWFEGNLLFCSQRCGKPEAGLAMDIGNFLCAKCFWRVNRWAHPWKSPSSECAGCNHQGLF